MFQVSFYLADRVSSLYASHEMYIYIFKYIQIRKKKNFAKRRTYRERERVCEWERERKVLFLSYITFGTMKKNQKRINVFIISECWAGAIVKIVVDRPIFVSSKKPRFVYSHAGTI